MVLANFDASDTWQMSVKKDQVVALVKDHGDGWSDVRQGQEQGSIPSAYIQPR